jgi:hypothetical protein
MKNENMVWGSPLWRALWFAGLVLAASACAFILRAEARAFAGGRTEKNSQSKPSEAAVFEADKGRFRILVNGQQMGKEEFEIAPNNGKWIARGTTEAQTAKGAARVTGTLELQPDGTPIRYEWSTQGARKASATVTFAGSTATIELHVENARPFTQQFTFSSPRIAVLDNNLNYQYAVLARLYDWNKKGPQTFSVLVPQELTPGSATVESLGKQDAGGKSLDELRVKTEDNEVDLYLDGSRLVRMVVPSANAEVVRE